MRRALLFCAAIAFAIACGDSITEPIPDRTQVTQVTTPVAFATTTTEDGLSISTDKDDYQPGDTVHFTGSGWQGGDVLDIVLTDDPLTHEPHTWSVDVGEDGTFHDSTYVVDTEDLGVTFTLTATSRATGATATVVFYDFNLERAFITSVSSTTVSANSSFTITAGATRNTTGNTTDPTWAGTSYAFNSTNTAPSSGSFTCLSPARPSPSVTVTSSNSASPTSGGSMTIPTTGLARGTRYLFIKAHPITTCTGSASTASDGQALTVQGPDLEITKTHSGNFTRGSNGTYTISVSNVGELATSGLVTVADVLPSQFSFSSVNAADWTCTTPAVGANGTVSCARSDALSAASAYSVISLVVSVAASGGSNTPTNTATVTGGGDAGPGNNSANDPTILVDAPDAPATQLAFTTGVFNVGVGVCSPTITVQTRDAGDNPADVLSNVQVDLSSNSAGGTFYSNNTCTTGITFVTIAAGTHVANFYYKDTNAGSPTLTATDHAGVLTADTQTETITPPPNQAPTVNAGGTYAGNEGSPIALNSATASDPDAGDVLLYAWTSSSVNCTFSAANVLKPNITCTDNGTYTATLSVDDQHGHVVTSDATVNVANVAPSATGLSTNTPVNEGSNIVFSLTGVTDPSTVDAATLHYAFDCGEGSGFNASTYAAAGTTNSASCPTNNNGTRTVGGKVFDKNGGISSAYTVLVTINNVPPTATFNYPSTDVPEGTSFTLSLTDAADVSSADVAAGFHYAFDCGDPLVPVVLPITYAAAGTTSSVSCATSDNASRTVKSRIFDQDNGYTEYTGAVTVVNVAPTVTILAPADYSVWNINNFAGVPNFVDASFTDPGTADTHSCTIDWGNGVVENGTINETNGSGTCKLTPVANPYLSDGAGIYTMTVKVTDDDDGDGSATRTLIVYDPSAGFVTGGGWITSPPGACYLPSCTGGTVGKANFAFVSKYLKATSTVPSGNTEFQFHAGNLKFHSESYNWLLVNQDGTNAQYKGTGTINGVSGYKFMLWATDGGSYDTFRIKIWTESPSGDVVAYDNMGAGGGYSTVPIAGGSIVIHTNRQATK